MTCSLNTRCSVIAASSAIGGKSYNVNASLTENTGIGSPLLSRFDLILLLLDVKNKEWDTKLARENLEMSTELIVNESVIHNGSATAIDENNEHRKLCWSFEEIKTYFRIVKNFNPILTDKPKKILGLYYMKKRNGCEQKEDRITVRMLESLIR